MNIEYGLSELLAEIHRTLFAQDFPSLAKAIGEATLEQCCFIEEAIKSPYLEAYARWWFDQKKYAQAMEVYKFIFDNKPMLSISLTAVHCYQSVLACSRRKEEAIRLGLESLKVRENPGTYWNVANFCLDLGRIEEARRLYLKAREAGGDKFYDIDGKLLVADGMLSLADAAQCFRERWKEIKASNFSAEADASRPVPKIEFAEVLRLAGAGEEGFAVETLEWRKNTDPACDFLSGDALSEGIAFQSGETDEVIHRYVYEAIKSGEMSYLCPQTSAAVKSRVSVYIDDQFIPLAYYFNADVPFFLLVERLAGNRNGLYFPHSETYVCFDPERAYKNSCIKLKYTLTTKWQEFKEYFKGNNSPAFIIGIYDHWGHTILNEYPSLEYLFNNGMLNGSSHVLCGLHEYLNVQEIYNLSFERMVRLADHEAITDYIASNRLFAVRPANPQYQMPLSLRGRVIANCDRLAEEDVRQRFDKADFAFAIWVEIRSNDRICQTQEEIACEVVRHLDAKKMGRTAIFVAGWSKKLAVTNDFDLRMIEQDAEIARRISEKVAEFSDAACFSVVGKTIYEKIVWADLADIHVCAYSSGIYFAYVVNKPLIVHSNSEWYPRLEISTWKLGVSVEPAPKYLVEKEFIKDLDSRHFYVRDYACDPIGVTKQLDLALAGASRPI
ncbi:MAG: hypothetical protein ACKN9T_09855 [Candidatus Methylumidiphilus sp.]